MAITLICSFILVNGIQSASAPCNLVVAPSVGSVLVAPSGHVLVLSRVLNARQVDSECGVLEGVEEDTELEAIDSNFVTWDAELSFSRQPTAFVAETSPSTCLTGAVRLRC